MIYNLSFYDGTSILVNRIGSDRKWKFTFLDIQSRWVDSDEFDIFTTMLGFIRQTKNETDTRNLPLFTFTPYEDEL
jgi:hypothetical protein